MLGRYGPDTYETRHYVCGLLVRFCGLGLSRAVVDAHALHYLLEVLDRRVLPGSTATPRLIGATERAAFAGLVAIIEAGHITAARDAITASSVVQPNARGFQTSEYHDALRAFAHLTPTLWREEWRHKGWVQHLIEFKYIEASLFQTPSS